LRQTLFFSATLSDDIHKISNKFVSNPKIIEVAPPASTAETVAQHLQWTDVKSKRAVLRDLLRTETVKNAVIFCNRKRDISTLIKSLTNHGFSAVAMHGDMTQSARIEALDKFKKGEVPLLIASDVAARGLDIAGLSHVFNFDVPTSAEDYVHRIGRTGRAGKSGRAFTIAAGKDDKRYVSSIETLIGKTIPLIGDAGDAKADAKASTSKEADKKPRGRGKKPDAKSTQTDDTTSDKKPESSAKNNKQNNRNPRQNTRNGSTKDELPSPPDCSGDTLEATGHIPDFLRR
jgi:superfamily II DNA/RNA helicase